MTKFGISQSVKRVEDLRLLTGAGRFVDDIAPRGAYHLYFLRSPVAHAKITTLNLEDARRSEGVQAVFSADDLEGKLENEMSANLVTNRDGSKGANPTRPILAQSRVRFLGEAVAAVVADTLEAAKDAAELIEFDYEELPVHLDLAKGGPDIHPEAPENLAFDWAFGDEQATAKAFDTAAHHVSLSIDDNRVIVSSMEPRGCFAQWQDERLHLSVNAQGVWGQKGELVSKMGLDPDQVRVTNPDVGGGFGMKAFSYPENFIAAFAARELAHPVRWIAERGEAMLSDNAGRDLISLAEAAFDENHKLTALRVNTLCNLGAYNSQMGQFIQSELALKVFPGVYDVQTVFFGVKGVYTNTTPVDAYRGAGRPEAIYVVERLMDYAARALGIDPLSLRRKNFIPGTAFPYVSATGETYDVGDFDKVLSRAETEADLAGYCARKSQSTTAGKLRGIGLCYYIESILGAQNETTKIEFADDGHINLYVGTQSNGQGHETVFAQILHHRTGIPFDKIRFIQGDSDLIATGGGTGGSRSVTMQGNSINATADVMIEKFRPLAEEELEVASADLVFADGAFTVTGTDRKVGLLELADKARKSDRNDLLETEYENLVKGRSYPNGAHFAEVEIDPETGRTLVVKYTVVDDFGLLMNPMLAEGQVHGGVAQGIGQAINEHVVFDQDGQLLSGSLMDYSLPLAGDLPMIDFHAELIPSTANDIGMKGCGEAGTVGALAAVANAALDAVWDRGVTRVDMPITPLRMWNWLAAARENQLSQ